MKPGNTNNFKNKRCYSITTKLQFGIPLDEAERAEWVKTTKARNTKYRTIARSTPEGRAYILWTAAKNRAKTAGLPFDLTVEWVRDRLTAGKCERTDIPFVFDSSPVFRVADKYAPSIDQVRPNQGYTMDNCQLVIWQYNRAKASYDDESLLVFARALMSKQMSQEAA